MNKKIPKDKKLFKGIKSGAKGSKIELFWERFGIILNPTSRIRSVLMLFILYFVMVFLLFIKLRN